MCQDQHICRGRARGSTHVPQLFCRMSSISLFTGDTGDTFDFIIVSVFRTVFPCTSLGDFFFGTFVTFRTDKVTKTFKPSVTNGQFVNPAKLKLIFSFFV